MPLDAPETTDRVPEIFMSVVGRIGGPFDRRVGPYGGGPCSLARPIEQVNGSCPHRARRDGMWDAPFVYRLAALLFFLGVVSGVEVWFKGPSAVRWRASLLIISLGAAGALAGAAIDSLTSAISPAYFAIGKELGWTSDLSWRARVLGLQAGCSAGVVVGAVLACVNHRAAGPSLALVRMWRLATLPMLAAAVGGLVFGALGAVAPPAFLVDAVRTTVPEGDEQSFVLVWCAHAGLYAGAAVGLVVAATRAWRARRRLSSKTD